MDFAGTDPEHSIAPGAADPPAAHKGKADLALSPEQEAGTGAWLSQNVEAIRALVGEYLASDRFYTSEQVRRYVRRTLRRRGRGRT